MKPVLNNNFLHAVFVTLALCVSPGTMAAPVEDGIWAAIDQGGRQPGGDVVDGWVPELVSFLDAVGRSGNALSPMASIPKRYLYHSYRNIGPDAVVVIAFLLSPQCARDIASPHQAGPARCPAAQLIVSNDGKTITRIPRVAMCIVRPSGLTATQTRYDPSRQRIEFRTLIDGVQRPDCNYFIAYPDPDPR